MRKTLKTQSRNVRTIKIIYSRLYDVKRARNAISRENSKEFSMKQGVASLFMETNGSFSQSRTVSQRINKIIVFLFYNDATGWNASRNTEKEMLLKKDSKQ